MNVNELQFTEPTPVRKIRGVYLLWKNGEIVYVGQSENIQQRIFAHMADPQKYFDAVSYAEVKEGDLNSLEAELIIKLDPHLNRGILPKNKKFVTRGQIKKHLGVNGWELRKILKVIKPVFRGSHYLITDVEGAR